MVKKDIEDSPA